MRNDKKRNMLKINYYAKILIAVSLAFLIYGLILDIHNDRRLIDPVSSAEKNSNNNKTFVEVGKENINGNDVVDDDVKTDNKDKDKEKDKNKTGNSDDKSGSKLPSAFPSGSGSSGSSSSGTKPISKPSTSEEQSKTSTIDEANNSLRNNIQSAFGVTVHYGNETAGYTVGGFSTNQITDPYVVNSTLNSLYNTMSLYPTGFFREIRNGGIPLTIYLIDSYSVPGVTGVTDSSFTFANISIAIKYGFAESFYHESYHYIERYLFKNGYNFTTWNTLNPPGFSYGTKNSGLVYNITFSPDAFFVNTYAQTDEYEDRASTFEYMMDSTKASCLNYGKPVWQKAKAISSAIDAVMNTASTRSTEHWERYI